MNQNHRERLHVTVDVETKAAVEMYARMNCGGDMGQAVREILHRDDGFADCVKAVQSVPKRAGRKK